MLEHWEKWESREKINNKYYVDSICDSKEGFIITLSDSENESEKVQVVFPESVHAYRSTNESYRQKIITDLDCKYGSEFYSKWTIFKVDQSEYLKWLSDQSYEISDSESLHHFSIIAVDSVVDIIAAYEPEIKCFSDYR
ncbi:hypothetical protein [Faecalispora anaeroviscerum]|uniref:hypothetical protein n=1 Tax=Faecalispora anaeroviscerum TaxID=2991836 RepID=UPI0024B94D99|nr:hypothetical protein [Faecalispora anaeroviscerum]